MDKQTKGGRDRSGLERQENIGCIPFIRDDCHQNRPRGPAAAVFADGAPAVCVMGFAQRRLNGCGQHSTFNMCESGGDKGIICFWIFARGNAGTRPAGSHGVDAALWHGTNTKPGTVLRGCYQASLEGAGLIWPNPVGACAHQPLRQRTAVLTAIGNPGAKRQQRWVSKLVPPPALKGQGGRKAAKPLPGYRLSRGDRKTAEITAAAGRVLSGVQAAGGMGRNKKAAQTVPRPETRVEDVLRPKPA